MYADPSPSYTKLLDPRPWGIIIDIMYIDGHIVEISDYKRNEIYRVT